MPAYLLRTGTVEVAHLPPFFYVDQSIHEYENRYILGNLELSPSYWDAIWDFKERKTITMIGQRAFFMKFLEDGRHTCLILRELKKTCPVVENDGNFFPALENWV